MDEKLTPPPLKNDCFALPPSETWTPVDEALALLRSRMRRVVGQEIVSSKAALGGILAQPVLALRSNPPNPNSAVDGYAVAGAEFGEGVHQIPLIAGRSAAGHGYAGVVPNGQALRILTGAPMPAGCDTVILQEDVTRGDGAIAFHGPLKQGANCRKAGEDFCAGEEILAAGRKVTPADLALLAAAGVAELTVYKPLRVAVISTGDELADLGEDAGDDQIYDANRPMLLAMLASMGCQTVDIGRVADDQAALKAALDKAADTADLILTSGGASAGEEDHVSALLQETGSLNLWRIAVKPGRPLALAMWQGTPVFGLPGNPVAAMVCTLIFARPAIGALAGQGWQDFDGMMIPAAFEKRKKAGRREFLRARMRRGQVEVFASEGSGRISGLSWAEGLVELPDGAMEITAGTPVKYISFLELGI